MNVLIIGGNSYIARSFSELCVSDINCTLLGRSDTLRDYFDLDEAVFKGYDAVLLCAAIVHDPHPDPVLAERINTQLPPYLARLALSAGVSQFVHMSTLAVYGSTPFINDTTPESPETLYGKTKRLGDHRLLELNTPSFHVAIIRPPMVYGPSAPGNFSRLADLIGRVPILPFGYGKNRRSMIYIENLVHAIEKIILLRESGIFLVRDASIPSLENLCRQISATLGLKRLFFSLPEWLVAFFLRFRRLPFHQLYGTLEIDDKLTRQRIGDYAAVPFQEALRRTLPKECR